MHRIRLRGPWEYNWLNGGPAKESTGRLEIPISIGFVFEGAVGEVALSRRFQWPAVLDNDESIFLVFDGVAGLDIRFVLNEHLLADLTGAGIVMNGQFEFDVTPHILATNLLVVTLIIDGTIPEPTGVFDTVSLEIRG